MKSSSFQRIESISKDPDREIFIAEEVIIRSISRKSYPRDEIEHINQVIGVFDLADIKITKYLKVEKSLLRAATFFLCGPCQEWGTKSLQTISYTGEVNIEHLQVERHISGVNDIDIKVQTQFLYDEKENGYEQSDPQKYLPHRHFKVVAQLYTISILEKNKNRNIEDFLSRAIDVVGVMCLLTSLVAKSKTDWFRINFSDANKIVDRYRDVVFGKYEKIGHHQERIISTEKIRDFINVAASKFILIRKSGINLESPIMDYVSGQNSHFVNDSFIKYFQAIEKIISAMPKEIKKGEIVNRNNMLEIIEIIENKLIESGIPTQDVDVVKKKVWGAAYSGLPGQIYNVARHLNIDVKFLDEKNRLKRSFSVRNSMVHSSRETKIEDLAELSDFLETLFEYIILHLLNWDDFSYIPTLKNRYLRIDS